MNLGEILSKKVSLFAACLVYTDTGRECSVQFGGAPARENRAPSSEFSNEGGDKDRHLKMPRWSCVAGHSETWKFSISSWEITADDGPGRRRGGGIPA